MRIHGNNLSLGLTLNLGGSGSRDLVVDGGFELETNPLSTDYGPPGIWYNGAGASVSTTLPYAGAKSGYMDGASIAYAELWQNLSGTEAGAWYLMTCAYKYVGADFRIKLQFEDATTLPNYTNYDPMTNYPTWNSAVWAILKVSFPASSAITCLSFSVGADTAAYVDNVSVKKIYPFQALTTYTANVDATATITYSGTVGLFGGIILNLSSDHKSYVLAGHDGSYVSLWKSVAGTMTRLTYSYIPIIQGASIRLSKNDETYQIYYNNALIDTQTISDAEIISNTSHGLINTGPDQITLSVLSLSDVTGDETFSTGTDETLSTGTDITLGA